MVSPDGSIRSGPALAGMVLAVDMAISPDGKRVAFVSAGNATNTFSGRPDARRLPAQCSCPTPSSITDADVGCKPDGMHGPVHPVVGRRLRRPSTGTGGRPKPDDDRLGRLAGRGVRRSRTPTVPQVVGEPIAVAFAGDGALVVQSREPAMLAFADGAPRDAVGRSAAPTPATWSSTPTRAASSPARRATPKATTTAASGTSPAQGARRTQSLHTGALRGTEPFHWSGDEADFDAPDERRVRGPHVGPTLATDQTDTLLTWIDSQPRPPRAAPPNPAAVERGRALFNDPTARRLRLVPLGRALHQQRRPSTSAPARAFQVPSLVGIGTPRSVHAQRLRARRCATASTPACGGGKHGTAISGMTRDADLRPDRVPRKHLTLRAEEVPCRSSRSSPPPRRRRRTRGTTLLGELSGIAAARFGKPERWVMTALVPGLQMTFAGNTAPAAFVAVKNIGSMSPDDTAAAVARDLHARLDARSTSRSIASTSTSPTPSAACGAGTARRSRDAATALTNDPRYPVVEYISGPRRVSNARAAGKTVSPTVSRA